MIVSKNKISPWAVLRGADLRGADLSGAVLHDSDLWQADLRGADLRAADLSGTDLSGADLRDTALDPTRAPNGDVAGFEQTPPDRGGQRWAIGYRTINSPIMGGPRYLVGEIYEAPVFSVCDDTPCHPGVSVCATEREARVHGAEIVQVLFRTWECHHVGKKHRVRWLIVCDVCSDDNGD